MTETATEPTAAERIDAAAAELGLTMSAEFVPFSQSRNKDEPHKSLNWRVTLQRDGREVLTTDYSQGTGFTPASRRNWDGNKFVKERAKSLECETGRIAGLQFSREPYATSRKVPPPELRDVLHSLSLDASVLDSSGFEDWASEFGYDTDSRTAERIYRACVELALKLRSAIGEAGLEKLREAGQDY